MTKCGAAVNVICSHNWCSKNCPLYDRDSICCLANTLTQAELIRIARKEYLRKSLKKDGKKYMQHVAMEWAIIGGAKVV